MTQPVLYERPFAPAFISELAALATSVFGEFDLEEFEWRLAHMPDATVQGLSSDGRLIAFKFGYAIGRTRYLSWLGGVSAEHRRRGLARALLDRQHYWARDRGYQFIETGTTKSNTAMLALNLSAGFEIIGTYARTEMPRVIMQKNLSLGNGG